MSRQTCLTVSIFDERKADLEAVDVMILQYCQKAGIPVEISCYSNEQDFFMNVSTGYFRVVFVTVRGTEYFHTAWCVRDYDKDCMPMTAWEASLKNEEEGKGNEIITKKTISQAHSNDSDGCDGFHHDAIHGVGGGGGLHPRS